MLFRVEVWREGGLLSMLVWDVTLARSIAHARGAMADQGADCARIVRAGDEAEVWLEGRPRSSAAEPPS